MDLEQLKTNLRAGHFALDEVVPLAAQAADAIESLQRELEEARKDAAKTIVFDNPSYGMAGKARQAARLKYRHERPTSHF
jgi:hypothetical protein